MSGEPARWRLMVVTILATAGVGLTLTAPGPARTPAALPAASPPAPADAAPPPRRLQARVLATYPHDREAFTQGLLLHRGTLYESTGLRGRSSLRAVHLDSGEVKQRVDLAHDLFGEGLARVDNELIQLSWRAGVALVYRLPELEPVREHRYQGEGWGLCFDGELLIMSDGSHRLFFRDPATFALVRTVEVTHQGRPLTRLNELECVGDRVYANVWTTSRIVEIEKRSGRVSADIDASRVLADADRRTLEPGAVLNGIAFDTAAGNFLITGKLWPKVVRVELAPLE